MSRKTFMTIVAAIASAIGLLALLSPVTLLVEVKHAAAHPDAIVMARTVGVALLSVGVLNFLVRSHRDSSTMRAILAANLVLQLAILPIDPLAYLAGTFETQGSFVPNTILHLALAVGFAIYWRKCSPSPNTPLAIPQ